MSQPAELEDADFGIDLDAPPGFKSENDKKQFTIWFVSMVGAVFLLQMVLPQLLMTFMVPSASPFGAMSITVQEPQVSKAFRWRDELWLPVQRITPGRPPQQSLRVLTPEGSWAKDRDVPLPFDVDYGLPDGDRAWLIGAGAVGFLQNGQVTTMYPRQRLTQFSNPFLYTGDLCVLDRRADGFYHWLVLTDGEWVETGTIAVPSAAMPAAGAAPNMPTVVPTGPALPPVVWQSEKLQAVEFEGATRLFIAANGQLWTATLDGPLEATSDGASSRDDNSSDIDAPASAAVPGNVDRHQINLDWTSVGKLAANDWRVAPFDGRLAVVWHTSQGSPFNVELSASWLDELDQPPFASTKMFELGSFGVSPGDTAATVTIGSFPPGGCRQIPLTAAGFGAPTGGTTGGPFDMFGASYWKFVIISSIIPITLMIGLVIAGHLLMQKHRDPRYCFGHDTVRLGSLGRRTVARIIDSIIYSAPFYATLAWVWWTFGFDFQKIIDAFMADWRQALTIGSVVVLGLLTYGLLIVIVMGALEGICGWSPGKLVCGLRVVRTNLRKCGVFRGVLRQILLILDGFFNYLVGVALIALLPRCQRVGDLASDTIVVEAASLPETPAPTIDEPSPSLA